MPIAPDLDDMQPSPERIEGEDATPARRWQWLCCPLIIAAIALAFGWPTRHGAFLSGDDQRLVTEHFLVNHPSLAHAGELFTTFHGDLYQPLPMVTLQLDYARAEPTPTERFPVSARPFHVTNIALHALNAVLAYLLATRLAQCRRVGLLVGLMFACHPFAVEPVAWISGRMILLATTFSLATLCLCIGPAKSRLGTDAAAILTWIAAILSKVVPTVPIAAAWCDYVQGGRLSRRKIAIYVVLILLAIGGSYLALQATEEAGFLEGMQAQDVAPMPIRLLLATRYYLENYIWPSRLAAWSPPPADMTIGSPPLLTAIVEITLLVTLAWVARKRLPAAYVGIVLFGILLTPLLAASAARNSLSADRYMYLPIIGLHLAVAATAVTALDELSQRFTRGRADLLVGLPLVLVLAAWMSYSWLLTSTWRSSVSRDSRVVHVYPDSELAYAELAKAFNFEGDPDGAVRVVETARKLWPESGPLAAAAGNAYRLKGEYEKAREELEIAVKRMPDHVLTRYRLGQVFESAHEMQKARESFERALDVNPTFFPALAALARLHQFDGWNDAAMSYFERALAVNPHSRDCRFGFAELLMEQRRWDEAVRQLESILSELPDDSSARLNLAVCLVWMNNSSDALTQYDILKKLAPRNTAVLYNRAALLASMGKSADAERGFRDLLSIDPTHWDAMIGLSELLQRDQRYEEMIEGWRVFQKTCDDPSESWGWIAWSAALAGKPDLLREAASKVKRPSSEDRLPDWAFIFEYLRNGRGDEQVLKRVRTEIRTLCGRHLQEISRSALLALATLPTEARATEDGVYALTVAARESNFDPISAMLAEDVMKHVTNPNLRKTLIRIKESATHLGSTGPSSTATSQSAPH
ncbi:MAG: hypothetical protein AMXMBFR20_16180 [Planctomycetia bacterium]